MHSKMGKSKKSRLKLSQYGVWKDIISNPDADDDRDGFWKMYDTLEDAVSGNTDIEDGKPVVYLFEGTRLGKFKSQYQVVPVLPKTKKTKIKTKLVMRNGRKLRIPSKS